MRRVAVGLAVLGFIGAAGAPVMLAALPACDGIPNKTCFGDRVNALSSKEDASVPDTDCTRCLQSKCCDDVGRCQDDVTCRDPFRAAHSCVIDGGGAEESRCTNDLPASSRTLYACARKNCGPTCDVPSCDLSPSVILFANASCDRCVGGACCSEINACYANRRCKLVLECILNECKPTLGREIEALAAAGRDTVEGIRKGACGEGPPSNSDVQGACINHCIDEFVPAPGTTDDATARCLAFGVYACGANNDCGPKCTGIDPPFDAGDDRDQ